MNKKNLRTRIADISAKGLELGTAELAQVMGGTDTCSGQTPYETPTATLNANGGSDSQTDCTSRAPGIFGRVSVARQP